IDNYDINLYQHPHKISAEVEIHEEALESAEVFTFSLNPGFNVSQVMETDKELAFTRDHQILLIDFGREIMLGDKVQFTLKYEGVIDDGFSYLDVPAEVLEEVYASNIFKIDKKYSFQEEN